MNKLILAAIFIFSVFSVLFSQTVTDFDGNVYNTVTINTQVWMKENLKVTHYNNGNPIANVTDNGAWGALTTAAYSSYSNDVNNGNTYGHMYNFYAVADSRKICPANWHVPADWEWNNLFTFLGGTSVAGGKLKETGTAHWISPNTGATNSSGFTLLPGGLRMTTGSFVQLNSYSYLWTSADQDTYNALYNWIGTSSEATNPNTGSKTYGMSVRCIRDFAAGVNEIKKINVPDIYPNPVGENLFIEHAEDFITATVYNVLGESVMTCQLVSGINKLNFSVLQNGVYVLILTGKKGKSITQKLVKK